MFEPLFGGHLYTARGSKKFRYDLNIDAHCIAEAEANALED